MRYPNQPQQPSGPRSKPDGSFHEEYGNPTLDHPAFEELGRYNFARPLPMFAQLYHQPVIDRRSDTDDESVDLPLFITRSKVTIPRPEDLEEDLLLHVPSPHVRQVYQILEPPTSDDRQSDELVTCNVIRRLPSQTDKEGDFTVEEYTVEIPLRLICNRLSIMVNHMTIVPENENTDETAPEETED